MLAIIPFSGFYDSLHDSQFDRELEHLLGDCQGCQNDGLANYVWRHANFRDARIAYAKAYAAAFCEEFRIDAQFESMRSPREYNFTTDRIFVTIDPAEIARLRATVPAELLREVAAEWFTSRDGFYSFYSPDPDEWSDLDHNTAGCIVAAYVHHMRDGEEFDTWAEYALCEDFSGNGWVSNWLCEDPAILRAANIADYLRKREERVYR